MEKDEIIRFRISKKEKVQVLKLAKKNKQTVSKFLRSKLGLEINK